MAYLRGYKELGEAKKKAQEAADRDDERYYVWLDGHDSSYKVMPHFASRQWISDRKLFEASPAPEKQNADGCTIWLSREEWTIVADVLNVEEDAYGELEPTKETLRDKIKKALGIPD